MIAGEARGFDGCRLEEVTNVLHIEHVAFLLRVCVAVLLELTELAKPVEMPRLCCNTQRRASTTSVLLSCWESVLLSCLNSEGWPRRL